MGGLTPPKFGKVCCKVFQVFCTLLRIDTVGLVCVLCLFIELSWGRLSSKQENNSSCFQKAEREQLKWASSQDSFHRMCGKNTGPWLAGTGLLSVHLNIAVIFRRLSGERSTRRLTRTKYDIKKLFISASLFKVFDIVSIK